MIHRPTKRFTAKRITVVSGVLLLFTAAVASIFVLGPLIGVLLSAGVGYVGYQLLRLMHLQGASYFKSDEDGIECKTALGEQITFYWGEVDQAGIADDEHGRRYLFLYRDFDDTLLTLPDDYSDFDLLVADMEARFSLRTIKLGRKETVEERLKQEYRESESPAADDVEQAPEDEQ